MIQIQAHGVTSGNPTSLHHHPLGLSFLAVFPAHWPGQNSDSLPGSQLKPHVSCRLGAAVLEELWSLNKAQHLWRKLALTLPSVS